MYANLIVTLEHLNKSKMPKSCIAVGCSNHNMMDKKDISFHRFPDREKNADKWQRWVQAMKRVNEDGTPWAPGGKYAYICSAHFSEGKPSRDPTHPDYVPSVFKHKALDGNIATKKLDRFERVRKRGMAKIECSIKTKILVTEKDQGMTSEHPESSEAGPSTEMPDVQAQPQALPNESLEVNFLRKERETLLTKITCLEQQVLLANYDPMVIAGNDSASTYLTGLSWKVFNSFCQLLIPSIKQSRKNLPPANQVLMVMLRLRLNLPFEYLSLQTNFSKSTLNLLFWQVVHLMYEKLKFLICWPGRDHIRAISPPVFKQYFPRLTSIIDCFEIFIERSYGLRARAQVYSNYKKHSTVKYLISCNPVGAVSFLSKGWGGRATDIQIVKASGFISTKYHLHGDEILADRGFTLKDEFAAVCGAELIIPSFTKGKKQLTPKEVETTRQIANVRIHIERVIGLMKNKFSVLQGTLPLAMVKSQQNEALEEVPNIDKLVTVCGALVNLTTGIVYKDKNSSI
ncbi:uncharacterized protein LOC135684105 [Rhopilema esculentum]|uniref:uncharacterized protein LOC135684105 n=1 Tax=Rhopilema esculentum TaxID=499914 RepID=UPI0031DBB3C1